MPRREISKCTEGAKKTDAKKQKKHELINGIEKFMNTNHSKFFYGV